eukprot:173035-Hanusia_phi.AAC.1
MAGKRGRGGGRGGRAGAAAAVALFQSGGVEGVKGKWCPCLLVELKPRNLENKVVGTSRLV